MKRKVIQIADSTQLISLPRKWAVKYQIKKGDEVDVEEQGNKLIVNPKFDELEVKKCMLDLRGQKKLKRRSICAAYLKGCDEIEVLYDSPEYIQIIQGIIAEFTGYDIVKQDKNSCMIKQISKPTPDEFNNVYNRLFLLIHDSLAVMIEGLKKGDTEQLNAIQFREVNINKYANFCKRLVNRGHHSTPELATSNYFILTNLEFLGDEYKDLSQHFINHKNIDKRIILMLEETNLLFENVLKVFRTKSKDLAVQNALQYDKLHEQTESLLQQPKTDPISYCHISRIIQIIIQIQEAMLLMII